eukprot:CAMPEP_0204039388 /NCGR_PEP_ID=MMETSP0360-20130528/90972_1 /ASSEMBLY_ACC=CAM_ASM_000342 /TAXON_ID=268821 /ORGANISM="Scrippsiella Hangoei, Strain SHTV-5" /LENGTH=69 /DNA_ID=CAMNT_0050985291 /DNA_START=9 /DNA_END=214 /DNA_ORIENTATION=+
MTAVTATLATSRAAETAPSSYRVRHVLVGFDLVDVASLLLLLWTRQSTYHIAFTAAVGFPTVFARGHTD